MTSRRHRQRDEFWSDQPDWDDARETHRTRQHAQITRGHRIVPGLGASDPTPTMQSRIFDFEDDPDYTTGTVRPAAARTPRAATASSAAPGGYAWAVTSTDDFGVDDWDLEADHSGQYGLGSYAGLNDGAAVAAAGHRRRTRCAVRRASGGRANGAGGVVGIVLEVEDP